jgi:hypothetical protein
MSPAVSSDEGVKRCPLEASAEFVRRFPARAVVLDSANAKARRWALLLARVCESGNARYPPSANAARASRSITLIRL